MPLLLATSPPGIDKVYFALGGLGIAVLALVMDMLKGIVQDWREKRKKAKQSSFVYLAEKQVLLDQAAERICLENKADHVALYRLHNGEFFEGDDSIKKMSMASEAVNGAGLARWKAVSQNMLMSNFPHLVLALDGATKAALYLITPDNVLDFELARLLNEREYSTSVALLVRGKKDRPLAMLFLSWCGREVALSDLSVPQLESNRRDLSFILSD
jgi:hypothetical protein